MNEDFDKTGTQRILPILYWKWFVFGLVIGLLFAIHGSCCRGAEPARNLEDIHAASCRVFAVDRNGRGAIGTGTICGLFGGKYYVLTNWHVVESYKQVTLQFFGTGRITECTGTVIATWHNETQPYDFAIITVEEGQLAGYQPPFVPLAQRGTRPKTGSLIMSSGCSEGRWPLAWKGAIESYYGETAQFFPAPKGGQSGSAIIEEIDGQLRITGILTWRVGDEKRLSEEEMRGGAIPISKLYEAFDGKHKTGLPNSIPPNAVWCRTEITDDPASTAEGESREHAIETTKPQTERQDELQYNPQDELQPEPQELPADLPMEHEPNRYYRHAIGNTDDFKAPVRQKTIVEIIFFTSQYCIPCKQAEPVVAELARQGHVIHTIKIDDDEGRKMAFERQVTSTPTFITYRSEDDRATWTELSRFSGTANLKERLLQSFSLGNSGGNSRSDGEMERPDLQADLGGLDQLFDEYENGFRGRLRDRPDDGSVPDTGDDSGLFRSDRNGLLQTLQLEIKSFVWSLFRWALIMIVGFWFVVVGLQWCLKKGIELLPKISIKLKSKSDE